MDLETKKEFRAYLLEAGQSINVASNIISRSGTIEKLLNIDLDSIVGDYKKSREFVDNLTLKINSKVISFKAKKVMKGTLLNAARSYALFKKGKDAERYLFHHCSETDN
jgi:hypothetical protein